MFNHHDHVNVKVSANQHEEVRSLALHPITTKGNTIYFSFTGPFVATQIWRSIISNLKQNVSLKKRRLLIKTYEHCFTGSAAVDVVLNHLHSDHVHFTNKDITREKAIKVRVCPYHAY